MPLRILDANGAGYVSDAIRALDFAARHGVRISNNSWGYVGAASQVLSDAIKAAGDAGQLVVVAAGNQGNDIDQVPNYPAAYDLPNIISVAATDEDDQLAAVLERGRDRGRHRGAGRRDPEHRAVGVRVQQRHVDGQPARGRRRGPRAVAPPDVDGGPDPRPHPADRATDQGARGRHRDRRHGQRRGGGRRRRRRQPRAGRDDHEPGLGHLGAARLEGHAHGDGGRSRAGQRRVVDQLGLEPDGRDRERARRSRAATSSEGTHVIVAIAHDAGHHTPLAAIQLRVGPEIRTIDQHADPRSPAIAATAAGTPVLAWSERGTGIVVSRPGGSGWSREVVSTSAADGSPDVAVAADGTVRVAVSRDWSNPGAFRDTGILVATDDGTGAGTGWNLHRISEGCGDDAIGCGLDATPSIAVDGAGRAQAAWSRAAVPDVPVDGQRPGPVARRRTRERQLVDASWRSPSTAASRRPISRSVRTAPPTSRSPGTTPATRACTRRRTSRGRGWSRSSRRSTPASTSAGRGSRWPTMTASTSPGAPRTASTSRREPRAPGPRPRSRPPIRRATWTSCAPARRCTWPSASSTAWATRRASPTPRAPTTGRGRSTRSTPATTSRRDSPWTPTGTRT